MHIGQRRNEANSHRSCPQIQPLAMSFLSPEEFERFAGSVKEQANQVESGLSISLVMKQRNWCF
jgi:hypothetical protein